MHKGFAAAGLVVSVLAACSGSSTPDLGGLASAGASSSSSSSGGSSSGASSSGASSASGGPSSSSSSSSSSSGSSGALGDGGTGTDGAADAGKDAGGDYLQVTFPFTIPATDSRVDHACGILNAMDGTWGDCDSTKCIAASLKVALPAESYTFTSPDLFAEHGNQASLVVVDGATGREIARADANAGGSVSFALASASHVKLELEGLRTDPSSCIEIRTLKLTSP